jgi:hypothetical protein
LALKNPPKKTHPKKPTQKNHKKPKSILETEKNSKTLSSGQKNPKKTKKTKKPKKNHWAGFFLKKTRVFSNPGFRPAGCRGTEWPPASTAGSFECCLSPHSGKAEFCCCQVR